MMMKQIKQNCFKALVVLFIAAQLVPAFTYLLVPKPAEAFWGMGDLNVLIGNIPDYIEKIALGILEKVAVNYANKYLQKFVTQVSDKYRIKDFLFYNQYLSDYYISNQILKNVSDPNLRKALNITNSIYVTGQFQAFCSKRGSRGEVYTIKEDCTSAGGSWTDPRGALIPALKQAMAKVYIDQGGIDPNKIYYPGAAVTDQQYFAAAQAYFSNPPSFTEGNLRGQFGAFQSTATTAAQLEISVGNSLKAGRIIGGKCTNQDDNVDWGRTNNGKNWDPVSCAGGGGKWNESYLDTARNLITNPTSFIEQNIDKAINKIFDNNFDTSNPYTQIGQALGDFIFTKIDLNSPDNTLADPGKAYDPSGYAGGGTGIDTFKKVDIDGDGVPDGQDNRFGQIGDLDTVGGVTNRLINPDDTCYFPKPDGSASTPPNCAKSSQTPSAWVGFCKAVNDEVSVLTQWQAFLIAHKYQLKPDLANFIDDSDAQIWGEYSASVESTTENLLQAYKQYMDLTIVGLDNQFFAWNKFYNYIYAVTHSLTADGNDLDLNKTGNGGDYNTLIAWSFIGFNSPPDGGFLKYARNIQEGIKNQCGNINQNAVAAIPPPENLPLPPIDDPPCTQLGQDEQDYMLPLLNGGTDPQTVANMTNQHFNLQSGQGAQYYPDSGGGVPSIGLPEFYVSPNAAGVWGVTGRCDSSGGGGGGGGLTCADVPTATACNEPNSTNIVAAVKAYLVAQGVNLSGNCGAFEITRRVAWALRGSGAGLLIKPSGRSCNGYAQGSIGYPDGSEVDILGNDGAGNIPQWIPNPGGSWNWAGPTDPGDPAGSY